MSDMIHLVYCSRASQPFERADLGQMLQRARVNNAQCQITGLLLLAEGSFFQVLEGPADKIDRLYEAIARDRRHTDVTLIVREPIAKRDFSDWTMGFSDLSMEELDEAAGLSDFFARGQSFERLDAGRVKKLLEAFRHGRWRNTICNTSPAVPRAPEPARDPWPEFTFAFQPILHAPSSTIYSHEALIRGPAHESAGRILSQLSGPRLLRFDEHARIVALELAARLGFPARLNLNFMASSLDTSPTAISSLLTAALRLHIQPGQIVLEILESDILQDTAGTSAKLREYLGSGLVFAIDDFGAGHAGLNLLADFQPSYVKLDMRLVRGIHGNGPRQAIVRGIVQTCGDLGIDLIAEGVETEAEYAWLLREGIPLFQGYLISPPMFEQLSATCTIPRTASEA